MDPLALNQQEQERMMLLKNLNMSLRILLASSKAQMNSIFENSAPLDNFCLGLEAILRFGFRESKRKRLFGPDRNYWSYVSCLESFLPHSKACIENVNNFANARTFSGKGRAWLRCALMEQTLESYISALTRNTVLTAEWYEPHAILCDQDCIQMLLAGLAPLSMIEFTLCLKDFDFDRINATLANPINVIEKMKSSEVFEEENRVKNIKIQEIEEKVEQMDSLSSMKQEINATSSESNQNVQDQLKTMKEMLENNQTKDAEQIKLLHQEIKQLTSQIYTQEGNTNLLSKEKEESALRMEETKRELEVVQKDLKTLAKENEAIRNELSDKESIVSGLRASLEAANEREASLAAVATENQTELQRLQLQETKLAKEGTEKRSIAQQLSEKEKINVELEIALSTHQKTIDTLKNEKEILQESSEEKQRQLEEKSLQLLQSRDDDIETLQKEVTTLKENILTESTEKTLLTEEVSKTQATLKELQGKLEEAILNHQKEQEKGKNVEQRLGVMQGEKEEIAAAKIVLQEDVKKLTDDMNRKKKENQNLFSSNESLQREMGVVQKKLEDAKEDLDSQRRSVSVQGGEVEILLEQLNESKTIVTSLKDEKYGQESKIQELTSALHTLESTHATITQQLKTYREENETLHVSTNQRVKEIEDEKRKRNETEQKLTAASHELQTLQNYVFEQTNTLQSRDVELNAMKENLAQLATEYEESQSNTKQKLKGEITELKKANKQLQKDVKGAQKVQAEVEELRVKYKQISFDIRQKSTELKEMSAELNKEKERTLMLQKASVKIVDENRKMTGENDELVSECKAHLKEIEQLRVEKQQVEAEISSLEQSNVALTQQVTELVPYSNQYTEAIVSKEQAEMKMEEMKKMLQTKNKEFSSLQAVHQLQGTELTKTKESIQSYKKTASDLQSNVNTQKESNSHLQELLRLNKEKLADVTTEKDQLTTKLEDSQTELIQLRETHTILLTELNEAKEETSQHLMSVNAYKEAHNSISKSASEKNETVKVLNVQLQEAQQKLLSKENLIEKLEAKVDSIRTLENNIHEKSKEIERLYTERDVAQGVEKELKTKLSVTQKTLQELTNSFETLSKDNTITKEELQNKSILLKDRETTISALQDKIETSERNGVTLQQELATTMKELNISKSQQKMLLPRFEKVEGVMEEIGGELDRKEEIITSLRQLVHVQKEISVTKKELAALEDGHAAIVDAYHVVKGKMEQEKAIVGSLPLQIKTTQEQLDDSSFGEDTKEGLRLSHSVLCNELKLSRDRLKLLIEEVPKALAMFRNSEQKMKDYRAYLLQLEEQRETLPQ